ncbi:hypothetical protein pEaSNUABM50_00034 [Erwinia phage pEa_SNUABM_50]|uniref:DUF945 domain-containing protein n=2 Tax=Eneladusvirus BF TaxID=2560751 RepID=A0A7L8ZP81_9CAUD|nr:hypothetical protein pEaSNUABM12_00036 [Erwinia phage pEa_SNUABM_12]QOI72058.1 hypothetical protein pEaSNUABM50_00034 [Erwinia phage pEa_SNUABM_50]
MKMYKGIAGKAIKENRPLLRSELELVVPSIFSSTGHESRSARFAPVATIDVVDRLAKEGYQPFFAIQSNVRDESKREFTKHMLRFRQHDGKTSGESNEIILVNANDGTSAYQLMAGQFRFVCANGLVMGNMKHNTKIYHKGNNIMDDVIEGVYTVVKDFDNIERYKHEMQRIQLNDVERKTFATAGYLMKEGLPESGSLDDAVYNPLQLLSRNGLNSHDQYDNSLYSTFNTVQQHLINGGQRSFMEDRNGRTRRRSSRGVTNINKNIDINSNLWQLATALVEKNTKVVHDIVDAQLS